MFDKLRILLKKPVLWQQGKEPFWDDEHISKGMLEAHLNPNWDSASRKQDDIDRSVKWISSIIPTGSKILDLGCGPGLYTKLFSDMGYDVTGIDFSRRSIAYAKEHDPKTEYVYRNYLELDYTAVFDLITIINGDYAALIKNNRQVMLSKIYSALKPGGKFIFDVSTERTTKGEVDKTWWSVCESNGFWNANPYICLEATYYFQNNTISVDQHIVITNKDIHEYLIWNTLFTKQTLTDEVLPFGFCVKGAYDNECGSPYTGKADTLCLVLEKGLE